MRGDWFTGEVPQPQRLVFGEVAGLYDRFRPAYPGELVDDVLASAGVGEGVSAGEEAREGEGVSEGERVLEVGTGTGKATELFAARGAAVLAVEPSAAMAGLARRRCAAYPRVEIVESDFERLDLGGETFPLLYSAQAWHWIDPEVRYPRARAALVAGGLLAVFWNRPAWGRSELRDALSDVYRRYAPEMPTDFQMHPDNPSPEGEDDWTAEIAGVAEFADAQVRIYHWREDYSAAGYAGLMSTLSQFRLLEPAGRRRLLHAIEAAIDEHGGTLAMPMITRLHTARAV
jgi:SAM-dependent methyltransferase